MCVYISSGVCMHACMCVLHVHVCKHVCVGACVYACLWTDMHVCVLCIVHMHVMCTCVCMCEGTAGWPRASAFGSSLKHRRECGPDLIAYLFPDLSEGAEEVT